MDWLKKPPSPQSAWGGFTPPKVKDRNQFNLFDTGGLAETGRPLFIPMEYAAAGAGVDAGEWRAAGGQPFWRGRLFTEGEGISPDVVREVEVIMCPGLPDFNRS